MKNKINYKNMFEMFKNFGGGNSIENKKDILKESLEEKTEEGKIESLKEISALAYQKLLSKVPELLSEEDNIELESLAGDQEKMMSFLKEKLSNFEELVDKSIEETQDKLSENLIEEISEKDKEAIFELGNIPLKNILAEAFATLEQDDQKKLGDLLENGEEKPLFNFLEEKMPNFKELLKKDADDTASRMEAILKRAKERTAQ